MLAASLDPVDSSFIDWALRAVHHCEGPGLLVAVKGQQAFCSCRQVSDVVLFISFLMDPQPGREVLQEKEHKEQLASSSSWQSSFISTTAAKDIHAQSSSIC
jgi:hypothetical protein